MVAAQRDHLSRRLSVGSAGTPRSLREGREDRPRGRAQSGADVCRTPSASTAGATNSSHLIRSGTVDILFANESRAANPLPDGRFRCRGRGVARRYGVAVVTRSEKGCVVIAAMAPGLPGFPGRARRRYDRRRRPLCRRLLVGLARGAETAPAPGSGRSRPPR